MTSILSADAYRPLNRWNNDYLQPGAVGSVGDTMLSVRLKHNSPDAALRWEKGTVGPSSSRLGTQLQDGSQHNQASRGLSGRLVDSHWVGNRDFKTSHGWFFQDLRLPDKSVIPLVGAQPQYSWNSKLQTLHNQSKNGNLFVPTDGYQPRPHTLLRGSVYPITSRLTGGDPAFASQDFTGGAIPGALLGPPTQPTQFGFDNQPIDAIDGTTERLRGLTI